MNVRSLILLSAVIVGFVLGGKKKDKSEDIEEGCGRCFLTQLEEFRAQLDGSQEAAMTQALRQRGSRKPSVPAAKWLPVECKVLKICPEQVSVIHEGKRNNVYLMRDEDTGKFYAHKTFEKPDEYTAELLAAMLTAGHPFIAQAVCTLPGKDRAGRTIPGLLMEHVPGHKSNQYAAKVAKPADIPRIALQLLQALAHFHACGLVHADLKPENVLIDEQGNVKLIDFGFAIAQPHGKTGRGTSSTMAPELIGATHGAVHEGIDWWAYGATVSIWTGAHLRQSASQRFIPMYVNSKRGTDGHEQVTFGRVPPRMGKSLRQVLFLLFDPNPERRRFNTKAQLDFLRGLPFFQIK